MATRLARGVYQLSPVEGIAMTVDATGTGYAVIGNIDTTAVNFEAGVPTRLGPEMMHGMGSVHTVNIRCFFTETSTAEAEYTVQTVDDQGAQLDLMTVPIVDGQALPYQNLVQIILVVQ